MINFNAQDLDSSIVVASVFVHERSIESVFNLKGDDQVKIVVWNFRLIMRHLRKYFRLIEIDRFNISPIQCVVHTRYKKCHK